MNYSPPRMIIHPHYPADIENLHRLLQLQLHHEMNLPPSENTVFKWLFALNETNQNNFEPETDEHGTRLSGNWLIFKSPEDIDHAWDIVKSATERGLLGYESLVRTAKVHEGEPKYEKRVICVSTYNAYDEADVWRVRGELWHLGFTPETEEERLKYRMHATTDSDIDIDLYYKYQDECASMYQD